MILPDINLLLYAYNPHVPQYAAAKQWWETAMNGEELIGLPSEVALGFVRIATNPRLGSAVVPLKNARLVVKTWLSLPNVRVLTPGKDHFAKVMDLVAKVMDLVAKVMDLVAKVMDLVAQVMGSGALVSDAVLASYAIENRATLHTNDADFSRFPGLNWHNPLLPAR